MQTVTTIGLDIAKSVFQVHGVDAEGKVLIRRQLKRRYVLAFFEKLPPCLVGIEACASSHHWSRQLKAARACMSPLCLLRYGSTGPSMPEGMMTTVVVSGGAGFLGRRLVYRLRVDRMPLAP